MATDLQPGSVYIARVRQGHVVLYRDDPSTHAPEWTPDKVSGWHYRESFGRWVNNLDILNAIDCLKRMRALAPTHAPKMCLVRADSNSKFTMFWREGTGWLIQPPQGFPTLPGDEDQQPPAEPPGVSDAPPVMHVTPQEAAKKLRVLVKNLRGKVVLTGGGANLELAKRRSDLLASQVENVHKVLSEEIDQAIGEILSAVERRKVIEGRKAVERLRNARQSIEYWRREQARTIAKLDHLLGQIPAGGDGGTKELVDEIHVLVQALPTYDKPLLTPAENVLHALYVVMRNNGYATDGTEKKEEDPVGAESSL